MIVFYILLAIVILMLMILIHELGHYVVGKMLGFKITEFSIGFFKPIWQRTNKKGEKISIRILPLGGYCAFYGEDGLEEEEIDENGNKIKKVINKDDPDFFTNKPAWKRILVFIAGVTFNFLSAIIFSFILLVAFGYGNCYTVTDVNPYFKEFYQQGTGLYQIEKNDKIMQIDGQNIDYVWKHTAENMITLENGNCYTLTIKKATTGEIQEVEVIIQTDYLAEFNEETGNYEILTDENGNQLTTTGIGFTIGLSSTPLSFIDALAQCFSFTIGLVVMVVQAFWSLITFQIPLTEMAGTLTVISTVASTVQESFSALFIYLPLIAANLAVFNILPLPALDGGHVVFTAIEWARGKPINRNVEAIIHAVGLIALLAFVLLLDIIHFLG